ncbi:MAG: hypothetical protein LBD68_04090 [Zoogloeaceae bacterium]|nr:hypothetical protein [Zoogloeaceae bacterium]
MSEDVSPVSAPARQEARADHPEEEIESLLKEATASFMEEDYAKSISLYDEIERRHGKDARARVRALVLSALGDKVLALWRIKDWDANAEESLRNDILARFGNDKNPEVRAQLAESLARLTAFIFNTKSRHGWDVAISTADEAEKRFGEDKDPVVRRWLAMALYFKGGAASWRKRGGGGYEEGAEIFRSVSERFGADEDTETRYWAARALTERANLMTSFSLDEVPEVYRELDRRFGGDNELPETRALVIQGLLDSIPFSGVDRAAVYADIERRYGEDKNPEVRGMLVEALSQKSKGYHDPEKKIVVYDEILSRFGEDDDLAIREEVARALFQKDSALMEMEAPKETRLAVLEEISRRYKEDESKEIGEIVADARSRWNSLAIQAGKMTADDLLVGIDRIQDTEARERLAQSLRNNAQTFLEEGKILEAVALYKAMKERLGTSALLESSTFALKIELGRSLGYYAASLLTESKEKREAAIWKDMDKRFGKKDPSVNVIVLDALLYEGLFLALGAYDRPRLAIGVFRKIIERADKNKDFLKDAEDAIQILSSPAWPENSEELLQRHRALLGGD